MKYKEFLENIKNINAVKQNGLALKYVKNQTEAICMEAVKENIDVLIYVDKSVFH